MNENDVIEIIKNHASKQFPRKCSCCKKQFNTFAEFIRNTTYVGKPISYDVQVQDLKPQNPIGTLGMVNCSCGSTIALGSGSMELKTLWKLMEWGKKEIDRRGCDAGDLLADLRSKVDEIVLREDKNNT